MYRPPDGGAGVPRGGAAAVARRRSARRRAAPTCSAGCSRRRASPASAGSTGSTTTWCGPTRWCCPGWAPAWCASRARRARWRCRSTATRGSSISIRSLGAQLAVAEAARNVACAGGAADRRDQLPELRQSRAARDHVAVRARRRGHGRGVPRARHPDHRRQRQPLQRDRRHAACCRRRCSASSV